VILYGEPGELTVLARGGDIAPGTDAVLREVFSPIINNAEQVVFLASLSGPNVDSDNNNAIYLGGPSGLKLIAREDSPAGLQIGPRWGPGHKLSHTAALNDSGQVAFNSDSGILIGDGIDLVEVTTGGQMQTYSGGSDGRAKSLNELGQIVYTIRDPSYLERVSVFTPDLSWRGTEANNEWDSGGNWTLSVHPAHVHEVYIGAVNDIDFLTPTTDMTAVNLQIVGPGANTTVKSLTIGSDETARHELELQPGVTLTALEYVRIEPSGILSGAGSLVTEQLMNGGRIDITNADSQFRIEGDFVQSSEGVLRMAVGQGSSSAMVDVSGNAIIDGLVDLVFPDQTLTLQTGPWNLLTAQSIEIGAEIRFPRGFQFNVITDPSTSRLTLRLEAAPEPCSIALLAFPAIAGALQVRHRRRP
jgi:hypothetical protein